eukprot:3807745-Prymnesium_polylepis.1
MAVGPAHSPAAQKVGERVWHGHRVVRRAEQVERPRALGSDGDREVVVVVVVDLDALLTPAGRVEG